MSGIQLERLAGVAGIVFFGLILGTFFTPSTPDLNVADGAIGPAIAADWKAIAGGVYLLGAAAAAFLVFASGLWSRLRRAEGDTAGPSVVAIVGAVSFATLLFVSSGVTLALVGAAREGRDAAAIRGLFELDNTLLVTSGFALALFLLGAAVSIVTTGALPSWLGWLAGLLALGFMVGLFGILSSDEDGGVLGIVFWISLMASMVWVLITAVPLIRGPVTDAPPWRQPAVTQT
jgi:hypothetical protein